MPGIADILAGLNGTMSDPSSAGLTGFAQGLLQASAPHMLTPVSMGQALGQGAASSQQYQSQALQNAMARLSIPFQSMKVQTFAKALKTLNDPKASPEQKAEAQALAANMISPGMGPSMLSNSPTVQGAVANSKAQNTPHAVGPNQRLYGPVGPQSVGAQGPLPEGTQQPLGTLDLSFLPGAPQAIAANAANRAGGAAAATFPYQAGLSYHTRAPGAAGGTLGPRPPPFVPVGGSPPQPQQPSPVALQAAQAARQRQAAIAQGAPQPSTPAPQAPPATPAPAPAASGGGLNSPGMTPSEVTGQQQTQQLATKQLQDDIQGGAEAQQRVANLEELNAVAGKLSTGPGTDARVAALKALAAVNPALVGQSGLAKITKAQVFNKLALQLSLQTVSSAGQTAYNSYESVIHAMPELAKTNMANAMVTASLLATARYQADRGNFAAAWQKKNGMGFVQGKGSADGTWTQNAPFMDYFMSALPPEARAMIFEKAKTNATLRMELNQAVMGQQWLKANLGAANGP